MFLCVHKQQKEKLDPIALKFIYCKKQIKCAKPKPHQLIQM